MFHNSKHTRLHLVDIHSDDGAPDFGCCLRPPSSLALLVSVSILCVDKSESVAQSLSHELDIVEALIRVPLGHFFIIS